jgi:hypothetical protein
MPNLVSGGISSGSTTDPLLIKSWEPLANTIYVGDIFYGIKYYESNGKVVVQEIDDNTVVIEIPDYRIGDSRNANGKYVGSETIANAVSNLEKGEVLNYAEDVYKTWLTSDQSITFSWNTAAGGFRSGHLILEVG